MDNNINKEMLTLVNRNILTMNGVKDIRGFDNSYITVSLSDCELTVEGDGLRIISLTKDKGEIEISGSVSAIIFNDGRKKKTGFFK